MKKTQNSKKYDLEERTYKFSEEVRDFIKEIPKTTINSVYLLQLIRSSSSIAANFIEANEAISKKDFYHRVKICRKEAKETNLWLKLIDINSKTILISRLNKLTQEVNELMKIFGAIISNR